MRKHTFATLFLILTLITAASSIFGAGAKETTAVGKPADTYVLRVLNHRVEDQTYYDDVNKRFMEAYPHIKVQYDAVPGGDYKNLLAARIAADEIDIWSAAEAEIMDDAFYEIMHDMSGMSFVQYFDPGALSSVSKDGKLLVLPLNSTAFVTFYNKDMFKEHAIEVPQTWDQFVAACKKLKATGIAPIVFGGKDQWPIMMVIGQFEMGIVRPSAPNFFADSKSGATKFTDPVWIELFTKLKELGTYFQENSAGQSYGSAPGLFAIEKAAMMIDGSWSATQINDASPDFEVGVFILPTSDVAGNNQTAAIKIGSGFSIYSGSKNKEACELYLEFLSNPAEYARYIDFVKMVPTQPGITLSDPLAQEIADAMEKQNRQLELVLVRGAFYDFIGNSMQLIYGDASPQAIAEKMQKEFIDSKQYWFED